MTKKNKKTPSKKSSSSQSVDSGISISSAEMAAESPLEDVTSKEFELKFITFLKSLGVYMPIFEELNSSQQDIIKLLTVATAFDPMITYIIKLLTVATAFDPMITYMALSLKENYLFTTDSRRRRFRIEKLRMGVVSKKLNRNIDPTIDDVACSPKAPNPGGAVPFSPKVPSPGGDKDCMKSTPEFEAKYIPLMEEIGVDMPTFEDNATLTGLMVILGTHARGGHCGPGIGYSAEEHCSSGDGVVLLSQNDTKPPTSGDDETRYDITVPEARKFLAKFQQDNDKFPPILEVLRGGREVHLLVKADGNPISLRADVWRALGRRGQLCLGALRADLLKGNGSGSSRGGGSRSSARQRTPITEAPEEPAPTPAQPPSSLPGLMNMTPADLATMLQQLKAQTDSMVRAQDLQAKENARIMSSIGFLTSSIGAEEDLADLDSTD